MLCLSLGYQISKKGKEFWKFNNALLQDPSFVDNVKKTIASVTLQYADPVYNFENLEKINYINKNVKKIVDPSGNIYIEQTEILNQIANFYQNLYSSKDASLNKVDLNSIVDSNIPKLAEKESNQLEGKLTLSELGNALKI